MYCSRQLRSTVNGGMKYMIGGHYVFRLKSREIYMAAGDTDQSVIVGKKEEKGEVMLP